MFRTLRAKLFLTYAAIAVLTLMLALLVTFVLARDYARRDGFRTLQEKKALALPYTQVVIASELRGVPAQDQRPNTPRQLLARSARESMRNSGLRLLLVDPETRHVTEDTASPFDATGKVFPLADTEPGFAQQLNSTGVQGTMSFEGEGVTYQYIAQRIRLNLLRAGAEPLFSIVVFAQPEPPRLEGLFREIIWYVIIAVVVALLVSLAAAYILARSISRPVAQLGSAATAMSRGDFTQRVPVRGRDELADLSRQFNEMAQEVGNAHQMERDFIANVSHDLKTPLTSIVGFSQAILDGAAKDEASVGQAASIINREAQSLDRLVGRLVSLSRLEAGLKQIELRPVDLKPLLGNLVLAFQPQAERAGIDLSCSLDRESRPVLADADQLKEAVNNLVENAIKYSASGGKVTVELRQEKAQVNIIVRDTGRGIPRDDLPRVMERFYQVDKARSNSADRSIGLGLAIASEVVRAHQGRIDIDSTEGVGTVVTISLPTATTGG